MIIAPNGISDGYLCGKASKTHQSTSSRPCSLSVIDLESEEAGINAVVAKYMTEVSRRGEVGRRLNRFRSRDIIPSTEQEGDRCAGPKACESNVLARDPSRRYLTTTRVSRTWELKARATAKAGDMSAGDLVHWPWVSGVPWTCLRQPCKGRPSK